MFQCKTYQKSSLMKEVCKLEKENTQTGNFTYTLTLYS